MTRINAGLLPSSLMDQHLMAEYRELPMIPAALKRSLKTKSIDQVLRTIPSSFVLGSGHVTFFYDKLEYLRSRYNDLVAELVFRGYNLDSNRPHNLDGLPKEFYGDWYPSPKENSLALARIDQRIGERPDWYRYCGKLISG